MGPIGGHISYTSDSFMSHHDETMKQSIPLYDQLAGNAGTSKTCCRHLPLGLADGKGHDRSRAWERDGRVMGRKTSKAFFPYAYGRAPTGCQGEDTYEQEGHPAKWNTSQKSSQYRMRKSALWRPGLSWLSWLSLFLSYLAICGEWQFMCFTVYLNAVKEQFHLTQLQVDLMLGLNNVGFLFTFPACLLVRRFGIHRACGVGTMLAAGSYLLIWNATQRRHHYYDNPILLMLYFFGVGIGCAFNFAAIMEAVSRMCPQREVSTITTALMSATNLGPFLFTCLYTIVFYGERHPSSQRLGDYMLTTAVFHVVTHSLALMTFTESNGPHGQQNTTQLNELDLKQLSSTDAPNYGTVDKKSSKSNKNKKDSKRSSSFTFEEVEMTAQNMNDYNDNNSRDKYDPPTPPTPPTPSRGMSREYSMVDMIYALNRLKLISSGTDNAPVIKDMDSSFSIPNSPTPLLEEDVFEVEPPYPDVRALLRPLTSALSSGRFYLIIWASVLLMGVRAMCVGNLNAWLVSFYLEAYRAHLPYVSPITAILIKFVYMCVTNELGSRTPKVGLLAIGSVLALLGFILAMFPIPNAYAISFVVILWTMAGSFALLCAPGILSETFELYAFHINTGLVISISSLVSCLCQVFLGALYDLYVPGLDRTCYGLQCYIWCFGIGAFLSAISVVCVVVYARIE